MDVLTDANDLPRLAGCRLVPTMGALHEGHLSLLREARRRGDGPVVATIFVNPTQFGPSEDLSKYPRTLDADLAACKEAGADAVFVPSADVVYPPESPPLVPALPPVATTPGLEDRVRPGHFAGVCQVVLRLFDLTRPSLAVFGEKDWQQLQVVRAMVAQERLDVQIIQAPTLREPGGLAMSSRNRFLSEDDRRRALAISAALCEAQRAREADEAEGMMVGVLAAAGIQPDYAVARDAESLLPPSPGPGESRPIRLLVAARVGPIRLLDNAPWEPATRGRA
ncbi:MAG: pantoate--beta-alanine ligase [Phycisphaeraceae bacterium]|nr:pantoate--beta-alanine ligase [Phycisphaeraceae bacterium]